MNQLGHVRRSGLTHGTVCALRVQTELAAMLRVASGSRDLLLNRWRRVLGLFMRRRVRPGRMRGCFGNVPVHYIGREQYVANKRAIGRKKDLADIEALGEV